MELVSQNKKCDNYLNGLTPFSNLADLIDFLILDLLIFDFDEQFDFWRPGRVSTSGARARGGDSFGWRRDFPKSKTGPDAKKSNCSS